MANPFDAIGQALGFTVRQTTTTGTTANWPPPVSSQIPPWQQLSGVTPIQSGSALSNWASSSMGISIPILEPETAAALIAQCESDNTLVTSARRLKFGTHRGRKLTRIDLKYLVSLGRSIQRLRKEIALELHRRKAVKRLTTKSQ